MQHYSDGLFVTPCCPQRVVVSQKLQYKGTIFTKLSKQQSKPSLPIWDALA